MTTEHTDRSEIMWDDHPDETYIALLFIDGSPEALEAVKLRDLHDARIAEEKALQTAVGGNP